MSETTHERVAELLANAESSLESLPDADDGLSAALAEDGDAADLREAAAAADDLLEGDAEDVLEAIGLRELPDGSEAGSIPEAIAKGDEERVAELRALLKLAKLSDGWDEREDDGGDGSALEDGVIELRETLAERSGGSDVSGEMDDESESDGESGSDEESADGAESEGAPEDDDGDGGSIEDQLQSAFDDALGGFGDEVREARDQFEQLLDEGDADQAADETDTAEADAADEDGSDESVGEDATKAETDDGRADTGANRGGASSRGSTKHSTMAPPPSKRLDMGRAGRLSTMPDRNARSHR